MLADVSSPDPFGLPLELALKPIRDQTPRNSRDENQHGDLSWRDIW